jgi:DNA polymerase-3 subunit gamma/tau
MTYLALYRKYRPQTFTDIIGQEAVVQILKNAIASNKLAHAYVFSGPRGTGKTSMARILAKALNCREGISATPCLKCDLCLRIASGEALDVFEIDAASNRGIDEIRDLREKIRFAPVEGKYKIYIIDEVHMLTDPAFNALLKTLEEPPENTLFILATTEPHKIPVTILSRCQRLDFKRLTIPQLIEQLKKITKAEGIDIDDKALTLIAKNSEGGMRDSVSLLDQVFSFKGAKITADDVISLLGSADVMSIAKLTDLLSRGDSGSALSYLEELIISGKNVQQLTRDLILYYRHLILAKAGADSAIELAREQIDQVKELARSYTMEELKTIVRLISKADNDMRWYHNARLLLEIALVEVSGLKAQAGVNDQSKITQAPQKVTGTKVAEVKAKTTVSPEIKPPEPVQKTEQVTPKVKVPVSAGAPAVTGDEARTSVLEVKSLADIKHHWQDILNKVKDKKKFTYLILCESEPLELKDGRFVLRFKKNSTFHKEKFLTKEHQDIFLEVLKDYLPGTVEVFADVEGLLNETAAQESQGRTSKEPENGPTVEKTLVNMFDGRLMSKAK